MAILKFEVDTDEIFEDYEAGGPKFEDLFKMALTREVKDMAIKSASGSQAKELMAKLKEEIETAVEAKMSNLVNEEVAFTDQWGKPKFIGTVEDYIKKQIDDKLFRDVDSDGKTITGCSSNEKTWVDWRIEKEIGRYINQISNKANQQANHFCKAELDSALETFKNKTLSGLIRERLEAVGVK